MLFFSVAGHKNIQKLGHSAFSRTVLLAGFSGRPCGSLLAQLLTSPSRSRGLDSFGRHVCLHGAVHISYDASAKHNDLCEADRCEFAVFRISMKQRFQINEKQSRYTRWTFKKSSGRQHLLVIFPPC